MTDNKSLNTVMAGSPFDSHTVEYDRWFDERDGGIVFSTEVNAFKKVLPLLPKPWLEIGVGSGRFARALAIKTGLDPSGNLLKMARERGVITMQGKIEDIKLPKESFGTVFLIMTICFIENPVKALKEIHGTLKQDGKIALGFVPGESPWGALYRQKKKDGHLFYKLANFYNYQELLTLLKDSGFTIEQTVSTLFQKPDNLVEIENPLNEYHENAGFLVLVARK